MNRTRTAHWVLATLVAMLFGTFATNGRAAESIQTPGAGCAGMTEYRNQMVAAGRAWVKGMRSDGLLGVSTRTFDERQWLTYAARAKDLVTNLRAIEPPAFAATWHDAQTDAASLRLNFAAWAPAIGFEATAEFYAQRVAALKTATAEGRDAATAACARFANLVDDWNRLGEIASGKTQTTTG